ncbi:uncharacterized protein DS421_14g464590 [Arachis hypogaea]|nr:uncharacterized protein DS421_14g464590 [Arachis hypogaea]
MDGDDEDLDSDDGAGWTAAAAFLLPWTAMQHGGEELARWQGTTGRRIPPSPFPSSRGSLSFLPFLFFLLSFVGCVCLFVFCFWLLMGGGG